MGNRVPVSFAEAKSCFQTDRRLTSVDLADSSLLVQEVPLMIRLVVLRGARASRGLDDRDAVGIH